ncbi:hypothetical protein [uncultured Megasphaera sp.]|nr:hypothetical protein [uncultured Megasphaera sp.]
MAAAAGAGHFFDLSACIADARGILKGVCPTDNYKYIIRAG